MTVKCRDETLRQRFDAKAIKDPDPEVCWGWNGATYSFGYGCIGTSHGLDGAHRVSWRLHVGEIPEGMCVLHKCDNPRCSNPRHLFLGTKQENAVDRNAKGRGKWPVHYGESANGAKLRAEDVRFIREASMSQVELAKRFCVSATQIWRIKHGQRWGRV